MKIASIQIENYKGFANSGKIFLRSGFNVVVGQNNSGKTAMLEAARLNFQGKPHRSPSPAFQGKGTAEPSCLTLTIHISGQELLEQLQGGMTFMIPVPVANRNEVQNPQMTILRPKILEFLNSIVTRDVIEFTASISAAPDMTSSLLEVRGPEWLYGPEDEHLLITQVEWIGKLEDSVVTKSRYPLSSASSFGWTAFVERLMTSTYYFEAERVDLSWCDHGNSSELDSDGQNLPEVLNRLQGRDPNTFQEFNQYVKRIFPSIRGVSTVSIEVAAKPGEDDAARVSRNQELEILIWPANGRPERADLAVPMSECGTGVGQVLAILYVVLTARTSKVVVIDEPNSFLHPGATRKLIELLKRDFARHQYIISTHSPEVIRSTDPTSLTLVKWTPNGSTTEQMNASHMQIFQSALNEVGVKMSDVFGADSIVWVEGPTEEVSIHAILTRLVTPPVLNASVIAVVNTGDFESKKLPLARVMDVYEKVSAGNALMPPSVAFIFDTEDRKVQEIEDMRRRGKGKIHFLPRRMFENYILDSDAIHYILLSHGGEYGYEGNPATIKEWIADHGSDDDFLSKNDATAATFSVQWFNVVHGAKLLKGLFEHFMGSKLEYSKTTHSVAICEWLIENNPSCLADLVDFLKSTVNIKPLDEDLRSE